MKKINTFIFSLITSILPLLLSGCSTTTQQSIGKELELTTEMQKSSYAQGVQHMKNLRQYDTSLDQDAFLLGMNDVLNKKTIRLSPKELQAGMDWVVIQQVSYQDKIAPINLAKGNAFLETNKQKPGVRTLSSGLQYKVIAEGLGKLAPTLRDTVTVNYRISRIDGEELAKSDEDSKAPSEVQVNNLIKGWQEALLLMTEGAKWQVYIPSNLAYGEAGAPTGRLGPNEVLIYDVDLVSIKK